MADDVKGLYKSLLDAGYTQAELGSEKGFVYSMSDEKKRRNIYNGVSKKGAYDLGSYEDYERKYGGSDEPLQLNNSKWVSGEPSKTFTMPGEEEQPQPQPQPQSAQTQETQPQQQVQEKTVENKNFYDKAIKEGAQKYKEQQRQQKSEKEDNSSLWDDIKEIGKGALDNINVALGGVPREVKERYPKGATIIFKDTNGKFVQGRIKTATRGGKEVVLRLDGADSNIIYDTDYLDHNTSMVDTERKLDKEKEDTERYDAWKKGDKKLRDDWAAGRYSLSEKEVIEAYRKEQGRFGETATNKQILDDFYAKKKEEEEKANYDSMPTGVSVDEQSKFTDDYNNLYFPKEPAQTDRSEDTLKGTQEYLKQRDELAERQEQLTRQMLKGQQVFKEQGGTDKPIEIEQDGKKVYLTSGGYTTDDKAVAQLATTQYNDAVAELEAQTKSTKEQVGDLLESINKGLEVRKGELESKLQENFEKNPIATSVTLEANPNYFVSDPTVGVYNMSQHKLEQVQKFIRIAEKYRDDDIEFRKAFGYGVLDKATDISTYDFGFNDEAAALAAYDILKKTEKGEKLKPEEEALLDAYALEYAARMEYAQYIGRGYGAGEQAVGFGVLAAQLAINPLKGAGAGAEKAFANWLKKKGINYAERTAAGYATRFATRAVTNTLPAAGLSLLQAPEIIGAGIEGTMDFQANGGEALPQETDTGAGVYYNNEGRRTQIKGGIARNDKSLAQSIGQSYKSQLMGNWAMMMVPATGEVTGAIGKGLVDAAEKATPKVVADYISKVGTQEAARSFGSFLKAVDIPKRSFDFYASMQLGNIIDAATPGGQEFRNEEGTGVFDLDRQVDEYVNALMFETAMGAARGVSYGWGRYQLGRQFDAQYKNMEAGTWRSKKAQLAELTKKFESGDEQQTADAIKSLFADQSLTSEQLQDAMILGGLGAQRHFCDRMFNETYANETGATKRVGQGLESSFNEGLGIVNPNLRIDKDGNVTEVTGDEAVPVTRNSAAAQEAWGKYNIHRQEVLDMCGEGILAQLDENPQGTLRTMRNTGVDAVTLQACEEYANAKAKVDGIGSALRQEMTISAINEAQAIRMRQQKDGMLHHATLEDGRKVDILSETGTSATVIDENGDTSMVPMSEIASLDGTESIDDLLKQSAQRINERAQATEQQLLKPLLQFQPGDTYNIDLPNGQRGNVIVIGEMNDKGETAKEGNVFVMMPDSSVEELSMDYIQQQWDMARSEQWTNEINDNRRRQIERENAGEVPDQWKPKENEPTEPTEPENPTTEEPAEGEGEAGGTEGGEGEAEGGTETPAEQPEQRVYEQGDEVQIVDDNGDVVTTTVSGIDNDGKLRVQTDTTVGGKRVSYYTQEQLNELERKAKEAQQPAEQPAEAPTEQPAEQPVTEETPTTETPAEQPQQQSALEQLPKTENDKPDFNKAQNASQLVDAMTEYMDGDKEQAKGVINDTLDAAKDALKDAQKTLEDIKNNKRKKGEKKSLDPLENAERRKEAQEAVGKAQQMVDYWQDAADEVTRREEAEKQAVIDQLNAEQAQLAQSQELKDVPEMNEDRPADARARGFRRVNGQKVERQQPIDKIEGKEVNVKFGNDTKQAGHVALVEADQLQPSHTNDGRNPQHFLDEAQPKERTDQASKMGKSQMAADINPEEITSSVTAYTGAPSVNARGETIQGNNRAAALKEMWRSHPEQAEKYKQYLKDHASEFGLTPEQIDQMKNPVLVNMLDVDDETAIKLGQFTAADTETGGVERIKPQNTREKLGDALTTFARMLMDTDKPDELLASTISKNAAAVLDWMKKEGYITPTQYASTTNSKGYVTEAAKSDLKAILYECVFEGANPALRQKFDDMPAKAQKAILATIWRDGQSPATERMITEVQRAVDLFDKLDGIEAFHNANTEQAIRDAVRGWYLQTQIDEVTNEPYLPKDKFSNFAVELATLFKAKSQKELTNIFNRMYDLVQGSDQLDLFNESKKFSLEEAIKETLDIDYNGKKRGTTLDSDHPTGEGGEQGESGNSSGGEPSPQGEGAANGAGGAQGDAEGAVTEPPHTRTATQERKAKERRQSVESEVKKMTDALGTTVRILDSIDQVRDPKIRKAIEDGEKTGEKVTGWYDPVTGEVVVYYPNLTDVNEAKLTYLHEVVGHKGLRGLFGDKFEDTMKDVYRSLPKKLQESIQKRMDNDTFKAQGYADPLVASVEEELSNWAEKNKKPSWWGKTISYIRDMIRSVVDLEMTDADIDYLLWRSRNNLENQTLQKRATDRVLEQRARKAEKTARQERSARVLSEVGGQKQPGVRIGDRIDDGINAGIDTSISDEASENAGNSPLYRLGNRRREEYERRLDNINKQREKAGVATIDDEQREALFSYLDTLDSPKLQEATFSWFGKGTIRIPEDMGKVEQAVKVADAKHLDIQRIAKEYDGPQAFLDANADFKIKGERINPDNVSTLKNKKDYGNGVVVYDVDEGNWDGDYENEGPLLQREQARNDLRQIINTHWGEDANPWCLLQGDGEGNLSEDSAYYWEHYNAHPKRVAFKDGKLLAFFASDGKPTWWDRQDRPHDGLPIERLMDDGSGRTATYTLNEETGKWGEPTDIHRGDGKNGLYEEYYDDGTLNLRTTRKNGRDNGIYELYDGYGNLQARTAFIDGRENGNYETWYENGQPMISEHYKDGKKDGLSERWYRDGRLEKRANYKNDELDGVFEEWRPNGTIVHYNEHIAGTDSYVSTEWDTSEDMILYIDRGGRHQIRLEMNTRTNEASGIEADFGRIVKRYTPDEAQQLLAEKQAELKKKMSEGGEARFRTREEEPINDKIAEAERNTDTEPTDKQKESGNYKKGKVKVAGYDITIENPRGSTRSGTDANGKRWEQEMHNTYGYIRGTEGTDGDHIDVFLAPDMDAWDGKNVYVVDQYNPDGTFDEHKVMLGFDNTQDAKQAYLDNYENGWENGRRIDVSEVSKDNFDKWIDSSHRKTKAFADYSKTDAETLPSATEQERKQNAHDRAQQISDEAEKRITDEDRALEQRRINSLAQELGMNGYELPENADLDNTEGMVVREAARQGKLKDALGERWDDFLKKVYQNTDEETLKDINEFARANGWNFAEATERYLASLADNGAFEQAVERGMWDNIKSAFNGALEGKGFEFGAEDNDIRYALWRNEQNKTESPNSTLLARATEVATDNALSNENSPMFRMRQDNPNDPKVLYRNGVNEPAEVARTLEFMLSHQGGFRNWWERSKFQLKEAWQDSMQALYEFMKACEGDNWKGEAEVADWMNPYTRENRLSSKNEDDINVFARKFLSPMFDEAKKLAKNDRERRLLNNYIISKHGLERNEYMAEREARKAWEEQRAKAEKKQSSEAPKEWEYKQYKVGDTVKSYGNEEEGEGLYEWKIVSQNEDGTFNLERDGWTWSDATEAGLNGQEREVRDKEIEEWRNANRSSLAWDELTSEEREQLTTPFRRDYAGLTGLFGLKGEEWQQAEAEARELVDRYETAHDTERLWKTINATSESILKKQLDTGLISKETYDKIKGMYKYYVPLRGFEETTTDDEYAYLNYQRGEFNNPIQKASGRTSLANDPFESLASMAQSGIIYGNRNQLVKQAFYNFVKAHPSDYVTESPLWLRKGEDGEWEAVFCNTLRDGDSPDVVSQKLAEFERTMKQAQEEHPDMYATGKQAHSLPYKMPDKGRISEHQVVVRIGGKDKVLTVNGSPRLAQAINGKTNPDVPQQGWQQAMNKWSGNAVRFLSQVHTTWNPDFIISNYLRDVGYSNVMAWVKENGIAPEYARRFTANTARCNPGTVLTLLEQRRRGTLNTKKGLGKYFEEFMGNGGETGYARMQDRDKIAKEIKKKLHVGVKGTVGDAVDAIGEIAGELGRSVELSQRFAAFVTSRESGRDVGRSIYDAKEITVNFNKKGAGSTFYGANGQTTVGNVFSLVSGAGRDLFMFWNAGVQGTTNIVRNTFRNKQSTAKAATAFGTLMLLGYMNSMYGGGDEDKEKKSIEEHGDSYWDLPTYTRRTNFCFRGKGGWTTIPISIELRLAYGMGEIMGSYARGREKNKDLVWDVGDLLGHIAFPVNFLEGQESGSHDFFMPFVPSPFRPAYEAARNRSWSGRRIYSPDMPWNEGDPRYQRAYRNTDKVYIGLSKGISDLTGGDEFEGGAINLPPEALQYMFQQYAPFYVTANQGLGLYRDITGQKEFSWRDVPIANRIKKDSGEPLHQQAVSRDYWNNKKDVDKLIKKAKKLEDAERYDEADKLTDTDEYWNAEDFQDYEKDISDAMKDASDPDLTDEEKKEAEREVTELQEEANATLKQRSD